LTTGGTWYKVARDDSDHKLITSPRECRLRHHVGALAHGSSHFFSDEQRGPMAFSQVGSLPETAKIQIHRRDHSRFNHRRRGDLLST
jgi:hypothetical protein